MNYITCIFASYKWKLNELWETDKYAGYMK